MTVQFRTTSRTARTHPLGRPPTRVPRQALPNICALVISRSWSGPRSWTPTRRRNASETNMNAAGRIADPSRTVDGGAHILQASKSCRERTLQRPAERRNTRQLSARAKRWKTRRRGGGDDDDATTRTTTTGVRRSCSLPAHSPPGWEGWRWRRWLL